MNDSPKLFRNTEFVEIKASPSLFVIYFNNISVEIKSKPD